MTPTRNALLQALEEFSTAYPDWRLGQLVVNLTSLANDGSPREIWDIEDEELLTAARKHLEKRAQTVVGSHD